MTSDPSSLRVSDEDRHAVADVLRQAAGDGRIDLDELDTRLEATYRAKTYGELVPITVDLPVPGAVAPVRRTQTPSGPLPHGAGPRYSRSLAVMSETKRVGAWVVEDGHTGVALMGSVLLDLREARFDAPEVTINAVAVMGEITVVVGAGATVLTEGAGVMGAFTERRGAVPFDPGLGGPVVRVRGLALMGTVTVQRKGAPRAELGPGD